MKILCVSDQMDPLVYTQSIKERFGDVDFVLSAGDLKLDFLEFIVSSLNKPVYFVFGNHDLKGIEYYTGRNELFPAYEKIPGAGTTYLHGQVKKYNGLLLAGLGGSLRYNNGGNQFTDGQMKRQIIKLIPKLIFNKLRYGRYLDILLTHAAPLGLGDRDDPCHKGFKCFLWFMKVFKPAYLIHGHIHLYDLSDIRIRYFEKTTIVNAFSHYIIDLTNNVNGSAGELSTFYKKQRERT